MFTEKEFLSEGSILRGRWYAAQYGPVSPCIVMSHGTSATVPMCLSEYAIEFQKKGFNVFLYDHVGFGRSRGQVRQTINPWIQARGIADAVAHIRSEHHLHNKKIILWGDSFAGMLVLAVGALINDLTGVVSFTASCGLSVLNFEDPVSSFEKLKTIFNAGNFDELEDGVREGPMPVVSDNQEANPSLLTPIQAFRWFIDQGGQWNSGWKNNVTRVIPKTDVPFSPLVTAPFIKAPVLMMIGREDEMPLISRETQVAVYDRLKCRKEFYEIDGGHFGALYPKSPLFYEAVSIQSAFIKSIT